MTIQIVKKDKSLQNFNPKKIVDAIRKSADRACIKLTKSQEKAVVDYVCKFLLEHGQDEINVEKLHNIVECALDTVDGKVAKCYRDYRNYKTNFFAMIDKVYQKKLSLTFIADRSNANADSALVTTQKAIVYNELNTEFYKKFFLNEEERKASEEGYIYIHDKNARLDTINCCLADIKSILEGGFTMGNLQYSEPKSIDVAFDLIADIILNMASCQYGGYTIPQADTLLAKYAEMSYCKYYDEYSCICKSANVDVNTAKADEYAYNKVKCDIEQGVQGWEMKFNSVASSRGDYPFTAISFSLDTSRFGKLISSTFLKVRKEGQGKEGFKRPVLFPKLSFFYDENLHGEGKELEWLFNEAIDCSSKSMYPDFISLSGDTGYASDMYKKYGVPLSRMGCVSGSEYITLKINGTAAKLEFKHAWEKLSKLFKVKSQKDLGYDSGEYIDLENVSILDKDEFVKCSRIIKNEPSNDWYLVNTDSGFSLVCTHDHVWTVNDNQTRFTTDLVIGDTVLVNDRNEIKVSAITNIKPLDITKESYDVTTETEHFICSGIRSHNCRASLSPWFVKGGMNPVDDLYEIEYEDGSKELVDKETYNKIISNE